MPSPFLSSFSRHTPSSASLAALLFLLSAPLVAGADNGPREIFASGFEGVALADGSWLDPALNRHHLVGTDELTGYDWVRDWQPFLRNAFFEYVLARESDPARFVSTALRPWPGPHGEPTTVLYLGMHGDDPDHPANSRNELNLFPRDDFSQAYARYWMRMHPDLGARITDRTWIMVMEWKEPADPAATTGGTNNWRANITLNTQEDLSLAWHFMRQKVQPARVTEQKLTNEGVAVPLDEWFLVETFWRWGRDGRIWFAIDGETVFDEYGRFEHPDNPLGLKFWAPFKNYRGREWYDGDFQNRSDATWFIYDDFAVWSDFPPDHPQRSVEVLHVETFDAGDTPWGELPGDWWFEGASSGARAKVHGGRLLLSADGAAGQAGTLWLDKAFVGDLDITFDVVVEDAIEEANNMNFFLFFRDAEGAPLRVSRDERASGRYGLYTRQSLRGGVMTFLANGEPERARFRLRQVPPFDPVVDEHFGYHARQGEHYHIRIVRRGQHVTYAVDGNVVLKGKLETLPEGDNGGFLGFRTWQTRLSWDNLVVRRYHPDVRP